jgi:hypothetical protein
MSKAGFDGSGDESARLDCGVRPETRADSGFCSAVPEGPDIRYGNCAASDYNDR